MLSAVVLVVVLAGAATTGMPSAAAQTTAEAVVAPPRGPNGPSLSVDRQATSFTATADIAVTAQLFQFRSRIDGTPWVWTGPIAARTYTRSGLDAAATYRVEVRAYRLGAWSGWNGVDVAPPTTDPGVIVVDAVNERRTGLIMSRNGDTARIEVTMGVAADPYQIRYRPIGGSWFIKPPQTSPVFDVTRLDPALDYQVQARAYRFNRWSRWDQGLLPAGSTPPPPPGDDPTVPSEGMLVGAQVNLRYGLNQVESAAVFEEQLGKGLEIINRYHNLSFDNMTLDRQHIEAGRQLMISWRATDNSNDSRRAARIANGEFDTQIRNMATAVASLEVPVMIRLHWDMDQLPGQRQYIGTPAEYIRMWRYIHDMFERLGTTNVSWVWAPRAWSYNNGTGPPYYPGDDYVDWVSGSAVPLGSWRSPETIFTGAVEWGRAQGKPILIWVGVQEEPGNPSYKPDYINRWRQLLLGEWSDIKAFLWYHAQAPEGNLFWADTTPASFTQFRRLVHEVQ